MANWNNNDPDPKTVIVDSELLYFTSASGRILLTIPMKKGLSMKMKTVLPVLVLILLSLSLVAAVNSEEISAFLIGGFQCANCDNNIKTENAISEDLDTLCAPEGSVLESVQVKAGQGCVAPDGSCYAITSGTLGVSRCVTVERVGDPSPECQGISHLEGCFSTPPDDPTPTYTPEEPTPTFTPEEPTPTNTPDIPTPTPTYEVCSTVEWASGVEIPYVDIEGRQCFYQINVAFDARDLDTICDRTFVNWCGELPTPTPSNTPPPPTVTPTDPPPTQTPRPTPTRCEPISCGSG